MGGRPKARRRDTGNSEGQVVERAGVQVQALKQQIEQLEREMADMQADVYESAGTKAVAQRERPPTASLDGRDNARQRRIRAERLREELAALKKSLAAAHEAPQTGSLKAMPKDNRALEAMIKELEGQLADHASEEELWKEKEAMAEELDALEGLLAEKDSDTQATLEEREELVKRAKTLEQSMIESSAQLRECIDLASNSLRRLTKEKSTYKHKPGDLGLASLREVATELCDSIVQSAEHLRDVANAGEEINACLSRDHVVSAAALDGGDGDRASAKKVSSENETVARLELEALQREAARMKDSNAALRLHLDHVRVLIHAKSEGDGGPEAPTVLLLLL